jgi:hypothetical protein
MALDEKFTALDIQSACDDLATIPFFPEGSRASVMNELRRMVPHRRALDWLVKTAVARCKKWPGMSDLRGLLCTRWDAADGIDEPNCGIPGYTAEECEARYLELHERLKSLDGQFADSSRRLIKQLAGAKGMGGGQ